MNFFGMGPMEIMVIMVVALIIFGPGKLPEIGAQVGKGVRDFKRATNDITAEFQESIDDVQSTVGEMKDTMTQVRRETEELAASIPAAVESSGAPRTGRAATAVQATGEQSAPVEPTSAEPIIVKPENAHGVAASRQDPLADLDGLDDDLLADRA